MSVSDERLAIFIEDCKIEGDGAVMTVLHELQRSRELKKQLRALAERMQKDLEPIYPEHSPFQLGKNFATAGCIREIDSLLSAHESAS